VPLVAINGQFETYGPEGGLRAQFGRQTQWVFVLRDIQEFRAESPEHLMSLVVQPGADHFHGAPEIAEYVALFLRKTAEYRLPQSLPPGEGPVECLALSAEDGWLTAPDVDDPRHPPAPWAEYAGDRRKALWHYDGEIARANARFHRNLGRHQVLSNPECTWLEQGDGWTFRASAEWLDAMPEKYGGEVGGMEVGHAAGGIAFRAKPNEPVVQLAPQKFRLLRPAKRVHVAAWHPGDDEYRATIRWGSIDFPKLKEARPQSINFPEVRDEKADAGPVTLRAKASSGLPVRYEVDYGPVEVDGGKLVVSELPLGAKYPIPCKVTAYQIGRRVAPTVAPAEPVSATFRILPPSR
jgi:hypothetical protein